MIPVSKQLLILALAMLLIMLLIFVATWFPSTTITDPNKLFFGIAINALTFLGAATTHLLGW
jgi:hypothetical protein